MDILTISKCVPYVAGPAVLAHEEAKMWVRLGHCVDFLTYDPAGYSDNSMIPFLESQSLSKAATGVNFHLVHVAHHPKMVGTSTETLLLSAAMKIIRQKRIDFINAHFVLPHGLVGIILSQQFGLPCLLTAHGSDIWILPKEERFKEISLWVLQKANLLAAVSQSLKTETLELLSDTPRLVEVLGIGVDADRFIPYHRSFLPGLNILFVGRLAKIKRIEVLIEAFNRVTLRLPTVQLQLNIVGIGEEKERLQKLVQSLSCNQQIEFNGGHFSDLPQIYQNADIFVLPSEREGMPNSLCEAAMVGLPIITTRVGSVSDFFQEGQNCLYTEIGSVADLAQKMERLILDTALRLRMRENNRLLAQRYFDLRKRCQQVLSLVDDYRRGKGGENNGEAKSYLY